MLEVVDRVPTYPNRIKITREDGSTELLTWERADEPVVEGTPINKALFDSIAADLGNGLSSAKTLYVSPTGSDALGDGSSTNPYATISKAVNALPQNLNGYDVTINIAAGTYNEDVYIARTFGGVIILNGTSGDAVNVKSVRINYGSIVQVENIKLTVTGSYNGNAISITDADLLCMSEVTINANSDFGVVVGRDGFFCAYGLLTINSTSNTAINISNNSAVYAGTIAGTATAGTFMRSFNGSVIAYGAFNGTAPVGTVTGGGGRIYSGAQTEIPKH